MFSSVANPSASGPNPSPCGHHRPPNVTPIAILTLTGSRRGSRCALEVSPEPPGPSGPSRREREAALALLAAACPARYLSGQLHLNDHPHLHQARDCCPVDCIHTVSFAELRTLEARQRLESA